MKAAARSCGLVHGAIAVLVLTLASAPLHAELDYELADSLLKIDSPSFPTEELIQRLITKLAENPTTRAESQMIEALLKRTQSKGAGVEKKNALLNEVEKLYKNILEGDKKFRLYAIAEKEKGSLVGDRIGATLAAAKELAKTDPRAAQAACTDAANQMATIAQKYKEQADKAEPLFKAAHTKYQEWVKAHSDEWGELKGSPPADILQPLEKNFDAWIIDDKYYVAAKVQQVECYDDGDPKKKEIATQMDKYIKDRADLEVLMDFPVIVAWYNMMLGKCRAAVNDAENANRAWQDALDIDSTALQDEQLRKHMYDIKKRIIGDLVRMKMRSGKYADVESTVGSAMSGIDPMLRTLFTEDTGKELIIEYARAVTLQDQAGAPEYERAVRKIREALEKEQEKSAGSGWITSFQRAMAELLQQARKRNIRPKLSAQEWYDAARGYSIMGQIEYKKYEDLEKDENKAKGKEQFEKAYAEYANAIDYYRRAITEARKEKDLVKRLQVEPKSWSEMGMCYLRMKHLYEGIVVYQALRSTYLPDARKKWLPDASKPENKRLYTKALLDALDELDKNVLPKSGTNIMVAVKQNKVMHKHAQDLWNRNLEGQILADAGDQPLDPGTKITNLDYVKARSEMEEAKGFVDSARQAHENGDAKFEEESYLGAYGKYVSAADKFGKIKPETEGHEAALYQAASAFTMAQTLLVTGKVRNKPNAELEKAAKDLADKALLHFDKYTDYVAKHPKEDEEEKTLREQLEGAVLLARISLYAGAQNWKKVVESSDSYVKWEQKPGQNVPRSSINVALLNKFRALAELSAPPHSLVPDCDPYLQQAEETMNILMKMKAEDFNLHAYMLRILSFRFNRAAQQADMFIKQKKMTEGAEDKYEEKVAELEERRITLAEHDPEDNPALKDYSRLIYLFNRTGKLEAAISVAKKMLEKFDPQNKNVRIPEDPKVWQSLLGRIIGDQDSRTVGLLGYRDNLTKDARCKKDHAILIDYLYDTREGVSVESQQKRPEFDKVNIDLNQALRQIDTIRKNFPECQTIGDAEKKKIAPGTQRVIGEWCDQWKDKYPQLEALKTSFMKEPLPLLDFIEDEIDFRRKIEAARDLLSSLALVVAEDKAKSGDEEGAKPYRAMASAQIGVLMELHGETPQMQVKKAEIDISIGNYEQALDLLFQVKHKVDRDREFELWFQASRKIAEVYLRQKKYREAAEFPQSVAVLASFKSKLIKTHWPQMKDFLKDCYAADPNIPVPPDLKKAFDEDAKSQAPKPDQAPGTEPKPEEPKADAKPEAKPEEKPEENKPEAKPEVKPEAKPEAKDAKKEEPKQP